MHPPRIIAVAIDLGEPFPHHQEVFEGVRRYAVEQGNWRCCLDEHPGYQSRSRGLGYPRYDGVIARLNDDLLRRLVRMRLPLVNTHYQQARARVAGVYHDPRASGLLAAEHLVERGCQRLSLLGLPGDRHWEDSCKTVRGWARGHGLECEIESVATWPFRDAAAWLESEKFLRAWVQRVRPPLGVYVGRAQIARLLHQFVVAEGLRVPNDIAIPVSYTHLTLPTIYSV